MMCNITFFFSSVAFDHYKDYNWGGLEWDWGFYKD
jgi:hypothetical protein